MAKSSKKVVTVKVNQPRNQQKKKKNRSRVAVSTGLDTYGSDYLRLLADPCGAPLTHPVYPGGDAGFLFRADSVATFGGGGTETCGFVQWTPGYPNASNSDLIVGSAASPSASITAASNGASPGKTFLSVNAAGVRCVAACMKVSFPGAESARSGRLHYGHVTAGTIDTGDAVTIDGLAPLVQHYTRTPPEVIEVIWRPGVADTEFNDPTASASATLKDRKSALLVGWAGIPVSTGMTIHFTAVYEWTPRPTSGVSTNTSGKNPSRNSLDNVLDALHRVGFNWVRNAASHATSGMIYGAASSMSNLFGIMPARPVSTGNRITYR